MGAAVVREGGLRVRVKTVPARAVRLGKSSGVSGGEADGSVRFVVASLGASVDLIDSDGDVTLPGFFGHQVVPLVPSHDWRHVPLGKGVLYESGAAAVVDARYNLAIPAARAWYDATLFDLEHPPAKMEYSYAFTIRPGGSRAGELAGRRVQFLQPLPDGSPGAVVHEASPVLIGAGVRTRTLTARGAGGGSGGGSGPKADDVAAAAARELLRFSLGKERHRLLAERDRLRARLSGLSR